MTRVIYTVFLGFQQPLSSHPFHLRAYSFPSLPSPGSTQFFFETGFISDSPFLAPPSYFQSASQASFSFSTSANGNMSFLPIEPIPFLGRRENQPSQISPPPKSFALSLNITFRFDLRQGYCVVLPSIETASSLDQ